MRTCGFHVQATSTSLMQAILAVKPTVIASLAHDRDFWSDVKAALPETLLVGRLYEHGVDWRDRDPRQWAEQCAALGMPYDAFITYNEPEQVHNALSMELAAWHDEWCCEFRWRIMELGYQAVALNVPTGHFHRNAVVNLFPNICQEFDYIGLHEYSARAMWDQDPKKQRHPDDVPKDEGRKAGYWLCQRYRDWYAGIVQRWPEREGQFQIVVSECGVAYGVIPGYGDVGWQTDLSVDQYMASLRWYFEEMNQDDYCLGGAIFMVGSADPRWNSFETLGLWQRLLEIPEVETEPPPDNGNGGEDVTIKIYDFDHGPGDPETVGWDWLHDTFGDVQVKAIEDKAGLTLQEGDVVYKLDYLDARLGDANIVINVRDEIGNPVQGETVMFGWPDAPAHGYADKPSNWTGSGVPGGTNENGDVGPGLGKGAYYSPAHGERGPHFIWVYDLPSDYVDGLGMIAGTNHAHLNLGYRAVVIDEDGNGGNGGNGGEGVFQLAGTPTFEDGTMNRIVIEIAPDQDRDFYETRADVCVTDESGETIYWESPNPIMPASLTKYDLSTEYDPQSGETHRFFFIGIRDWTDANKKPISWLGPFRYETGEKGTWKAQVVWTEEEPEPDGELEERVEDLEEGLADLRTDIIDALRAAADRL